MPPKKGKKASKKTIDTSKKVEIEPQNDLLTPQIDDPTTLQPDQFNELIDKAASMFNEIKKQLSEQISILEADYFKALSYTIKDADQLKQLIKQYESSLKQKSMDNEQGMTKDQKE